MFFYIHVDVKVYMENTKYSTNMILPIWKSIIHENVALKLKAEIVKSQRVIKWKVSSYSYYKLEMNLIISKTITGKMWSLTPHYDLDLGLGDIKRTRKHKKDHSLSQSICLPEYVYAFNVPPTAIKGHMERRPRLRVSSYRPEEPGIKLGTSLSTRYYTMAAQ